MSAPTALETGALLRGIARPAHHNPQTRTHRLPTVERRSRRPLPRLSREHDELCRQACDPFEIAAGLEAAGIDDRRARTEFQVAGVFELAEQLWTLVPWRAVPETQTTDRWQLPLWRAQLRGVLYAVPSLLVTAVLGQVGPGMPAFLLLVATAMSVGGGQALSVLGHLLAGRAQDRAVHALGRIALTGAAGVGAALIAGFGIARASLGISLAAGFQLVFVAAATQLMIRGADRLMLALTAPGAALCAAELLGARVETLAGVDRAVITGIGPSVSLLGVVLAAVLPLRAGQGITLRLAIGRNELAAAGAAALYGTGLSLVVAAAMIAVNLGRLPNPGSWLLGTTLPMTATFGTAEYLLHRTRSRAAAGLGQEQTAVRFIRRLQVELRMMVVLHAVAAGLITVAVVLLGISRGAPVEVAWLTGDYAILALTLLLLTTLMSMGYLRIATTVVGLGAAVLLVPLIVTGLQGAALAGCEGILALALLTVTYRITAARFCTVTAHR